MLHVLYEGILVDTANIGTLMAILGVVCSVLGSITDDIITDSNESQKNFQCLKKNHHF